MVIGLERAFAEDLRVLLDYLQSRLRLTDDLGWLEDQSLAVLLPMTGSAQAHTAAEYNEPHRIVDCGRVLATFLYEKLAA